MRSVVGHKPLVRPRTEMVGFITTQVTEGIFRGATEGERGSHRKPNTMVIRGWVCFRVTSSIRRRKKIRSSRPPSSSVLSASCQALKIYWTPLPAIPPPPFLSLSVSLSLSLTLPTLSWLDRRQAFRYLNNPPIRLSSGVGMISRIYSPSTYEE